LSVDAASDAVFGVAVARRRRFARHLMMGLHR
jgi:hypothetical protein